MRTGNIDRKTNETDIKLNVNLDGSGKADIATGCGFLDHMLNLFARHGRFDLTVKCVGDTYVDYHHTRISESVSARPSKKPSATRKA